MKKLFTIILVALILTTTQAQNPLLIPDTLTGSVINLSLQAGTMNFYPGTPTNTHGVNGNILGPTLILHRDSNVTMHVTNNLSNITTIHWHGMHVAPQNDGGPQMTIAPGERAEILMKLDTSQVGQSFNLVNYGMELPMGIYGAMQPGMCMGITISGYNMNPLNGANFTVLKFNVVASTANPVATIPATLVTHDPWQKSMANATRTINITF